MAGPALDLDRQFRPRQTRDFVDSIWMHGAAPRARGTVKDTFELVAASGEIAPEVEQADK